MPDSTAQTSPEKIRDLLSTALDSGSFQGASRLLHTLHPAEIGNLLESMPRAERDLAWELINPDDEGEVLLHVGDEVRGRLIHKADPIELANSLEGMALDDLADIIDDLPQAVTTRVLQAMDQQNRELLEAVRSYDEDSAGGMMDTDLVTVRSDVSIDVVQRYLRMLGKLPSGTDALFVVDRYKLFLGTLPLATLLTCDTDSLVQDVLQPNKYPILAETQAKEVAKQFETHDLVSAPVLNEAGLLLGRITIDDVVDVIRDEAEHSLLSMAGLDEEEDMFAPVLQSAKRRALWLGVNLFTALLASWVVGLFQATIDQVVALAVLMPLVASMGGIAGSQTLTLVIRAQALGQISSSNIRSLMTKEMAVGGINSLIWATIVAGVAVLWFKSATLAYIIGGALIINILFAAVSGIAVPIILKKLNIDPALAGSVILTTVTDVVGFFTFLGMGSIFLL